MRKTLWDRFRLWMGCLYIIHYSCTFCNYAGTIKMSHMDYAFIGPKKVIKCPKCGFKTLYKRSVE